jgi:hypothetical protein
MMRQLLVGHFGYDDSFDPVAGLDEQITSYSSSPANKRWIMELVMHCPALTISAYSQQKWALTCWF